MIGNGSISELFTIIQLNQTQLRVVSARSDKLCIQRDVSMCPGLFADLLQCVIGRDQLIIQNVILLVVISVIFQVAGLLATAFLFLKIYWL